MSLCSFVSLLPVAFTWHAVCPCCDLGRGIPEAIGANKDSLLTNCDSDGVVKKWGFYHSAAFVSQFLLFPVSCSWFLLRFIRFEQFQRKGKDFKDITILQVLNMGRWLWDYTAGNPIQYEAAENLAAGRLMKRSILLLFEQLEKLQLKLSSSCVLQNAVLKWSRMEPGLVISVLVKLCALYYVLCCQMLPEKKKK